MHRQIQVLPDALVNQIAAGEVVERPASVVKELVENALDAGASHISVEIEGGGMRRIRVVDDGQGMSPAQAELSLQRHATSKLSAIDDLFALDTFGFRGEALPSIASVSKFTMTTRSREDGSEEQVGACRLHVVGGRVVSRSEVGAPMGTCIEVEDLLFNVPARQKFLKGEATETSHITDTLSKLALANPSVHFRLKNRQRSTINAPAHESYEERVLAVMGPRLGEGAHMVAGEYGGVRVRAFLARPEVAQSTTRGLQLFVSRRPIRDRGVLYAVLQGYQELIPRGRYPVAVILIDTPRADVDVNVHPQKLEVRFSDPQLVYAAVRQVVRTGVAEAHWAESELGADASFSHLQVHASTRPPYGAQALQARQSFANQDNGQAASPLALRYAREQARMMLPWGKAKATPQQESAPISRSAEGSGPVRGTSLIPESAESARAQVAGQGLGDAHPELRSGFFRSLRYLGQLDRTYLLCEADGELVMLDQHSAHERVELEKLLLRYREKSMPVQRLLFAQTIELSAEQAAAADAHGDQLATMGFELDDFGDNAGRQSYALKAVPAGLRTQQPEELVLTLLTELARTGSERAIDDKIESMLATVACHSVVRAGDTLSGREVESLLHAMDEVDFRGLAPHGRPVLLRIGVDEIARRFGRS